jgi:hypothetical protein
MARKVFRGIFFFAVLSAVVFFFDKVSRSGPQKKGNVRVSADLALFSAADAFTGPGLMDRMANQMIPDKDDSLPDFEGQRSTAGIAPGGLIGGDGAGSRAGAAGSGAAGGADEAGAGEDAEETERQRLRRIRMLEIERGERRMYGTADRTPAGLSSPNSPAFRRTRRAREPSDAEIAAELSGFVDKLKTRATERARNNPSVGSSLEDADRIAGGEGELPVLSLEGVDNRLQESPTLRALQQLNKDGAHSLRMSRRSGMTDGTRDKAGKRFDGNEKTMDSIPIEEVTGAFGKKQIKTYEDAGAPMDLK